MNTDELLEKLKTDPDSIIDSGKIRVMSMVKNSNYILKLSTNDETLNVPVKFIGTGYLVNGKKSLNDNNLPVSKMDSMDRYYFTRLDTGSDIEASNVDGKLRLDLDSVSYSVAPKKIKVQSSGNRYIESDDDFWDRQRALYPKYKSRPLEINIPCTDDNVESILSIFTNPTHWTFEDERGKFVVVIFDFTIKYNRMIAELKKLGIDEKDCFDTGGFSW